MRRSKGVNVNPVYRFSHVAGIVFGILLGITLSGCLLTSSQRAEENFTDGKMPTTLEKFANYRQSHKYQNKIQNLLVENEKNSNFKLRVAVIDEGTEIYHPDLIEKIAWRKDANNQIGLLGYDFMGKDSIPTPDRIVPDYFAYGADSIIDGKIDKAPENPLEIMASHNLSFMTELIKEL